MSKCISHLIAVGTVFLAATNSHAVECQNVEYGQFIPKESPQYAEVIAASDGGPAATWGGGVEWYGPLSTPPRHGPPPQSTDRLVWLYGPDNPWWQGAFSLASDEVWVQLSGCDSNDGVAEIWLDGVHECDTLTTRNKGAVLIKLEELANSAHTIKVRKKTAGATYNYDVSIAYVAIPYPSQVKMHFPQSPDEEGWDVNATSPLVVADDWRCTESSLVDEICFWGSWKDDVVGTITNFHLSIHGDIPFYPLMGFSMPGPLLWSGDFPLEDFGVAGPFTGDQGWYDPSMPVAIPNDHQQYFEYCIINIADPPKQREGDIYWLDISATVEEPDRFWGWKTSKDAWNDDAVWSPEIPSPTWDEMYDPLTFLETVDALPPVNAAVLIPENSPVNGWYYYPNTGWWNVWFQDHPLDWNSSKVVHIHLDVDDAAPGAFLTVAVNWSTYMWTLEGTPGLPPYPGEVPTEELEDLYIGREILLPETPVDVGPIDLYWVWPYYNPEWVSVDVRGEGFGISGSITHRCARSLNQAFEIRTRSPIPAVSEWGLVVMLLLVVAAATIVIRRRRTVAA